MVQGRSRSQRKKLPSPRRRRSRSRSQRKILPRPTRRRSRSRSQRKRLPSPTRRRSRSRSQRKRLPSPTRRRSRSRSQRKRLPRPMWRRDTSNSNQPPATALPIQPPAKARPLAKAPPVHPQAPPVQPPAKAPPIQPAPCKALPVDEILRSKAQPNQRPFPVQNRMDGSLRPRSPSRPPSWWIPAAQNNPHLRERAPASSPEADFEEALEVVRFPTTWRTLRPIGQASTPIGMAPRRVSGPRLLKESGGDLVGLHLQEATQPTPESKEPAESPTAPKVHMNIF